MTRQRSSEHGGAMMMTLIVVAALLSGAGLLASMQIRSTRAAAVARSGLSALYCAEAGLAGARDVVARNYSAWSGSLCSSADRDTCSEPAFLTAGFDHDLDDNGTSDVKIVLVDNDDETTGPSDKTRDNDMRVFLAAKCLSSSDTPREIMELVELNGASGCYEAQLGGGTGYGNQCR